ncbi:MAG: phage portal protein [Saprospiraceae bacterium]|nr:phage portal protein [Saprospiraceae bacterium]
MASLFSNIARFFVKSEAVEQRRANINNPNTPLTPDNIFGYIGGQAKAGVTVDGESALSLSAVWRAVDILSATIALLPIEIIRETAKGDQTHARKHPVQFLLADSPNEEVSVYDFMQTLVANAALTGNGYAYIERDLRQSSAKAIYNLDPARVTPYFDGMGRLFYRVDMFKDAIAPRDMLHIKGLSWNSFSGLDMVRHHKENFGLALANRDYGANFYSNGAHLSGVLVHPGKLSNDAYGRLASSWRQTYGGANNAGATAILEEGTRFERLGLDPTTAQFLETGRKTIADISRIFGVPQFLLEDLDRATFNNIEQLTLLFVRHTILPWCERIRNEFNRKVFATSERGRYKIRFVLSSLLQGDTQSRGEYYSKLFNIGALSPNDIRRMEGLNPIDGGDKYFVQVNMGDITDDREEPGGEDVPDENIMPNGSAESDE